MSGRICCFHLLALVGDQAPRKDDGTDFECAWMQSNGIIALEIKCYCRRFVNSCGTVLFWGGVGKGFLTNLVTSQKSLIAYGVVFNRYFIG